MGEHLQMRAFSLLYEEVNKIFRELLRYNPSALRLAETLDVPCTDIYEDEQALWIEIELPGIDPAQTRISLAGNMLVIEGLKEEQAEDGRINYLCMERSFGRFRRTVAIPMAIDPQKSTAAYRQGILILRLPKRQEKRGAPLIIAVEISDQTEEASGR